MGETTRKTQLSELYRETLELFKAGKVGLVTDIDGTLSPIAATPDQAFVSEECRAALLKLAENGWFEVVAVVSGRSAKAARELVGLPQLVYLGNHGLELLEPGIEEPSAVRAAQAYQPLISSALETVKYKVLQNGKAIEDSEEWLHQLIFEDKGVSASIHYRLCNNPGLARQIILQQLNEVARQTGLQLSEGRMVIELRPPVRINKGTALVDLVETYQLAGLVFIGDDLTDVEGFRAIRRLELESHHHLPPAPSFNFNNSSLPSSTAPAQSWHFKGLAVGVQSPEMPAILTETADYLMEGVGGVEQYFLWLGTQFMAQPPPLQTRNKLD